MWLPWEYAVVLAVAFLAIAAWARSRTFQAATTVHAFAREAAIIALLYSLWQFAGRISLMQIDGAHARGLWIWEFQQSIGLPSEKAWQDAALGNSWLIQASNLYYGGVHVPAMGVFLVWLFARHRDRYPLWRNALALTTGACLAIQLLPVAPPRFVEETGIIDTPALYGQSVYSALGSRLAGQLQAMPSIHIAWAVLIGWAVVQVSTSRHRWWWLLHPLATAYVVVVTGNHFWLDGIVAVVVLGVIVAGLQKLAAIRTPAEPEPVVTPTVARFR